MSKFSEENLPTQNLKQRWLIKANVVLIVAGPGIAPRPGGYAYHYDFHRFALKCKFADLDYTFPSPIFSNW